MSADLDPDLALVRKLHLELNGSGRRTRGPAPPPLKKAKRETSRPLDEALKDSSSISISGSGSGSGKVPKREGTLRRLVKKQPNSDSNQDTIADDEENHAEAASLAAAKESLEPQASTKAMENRQKLATRGDVGSTITPDLITDNGFALNAEAAATLARAAASREKRNSSTRVKCFYMGYPYGLSFNSQAFESKGSLAKALKAALSADYPVCSSEEMEIFAYDKNGNQLVCSPEDSSKHWDSALKAAKRIYVSGATST